MKNKLMTILVSLLCVITYAQEQEEKGTIYLKDLEGIWQNVEYPKQYNILRNKKLLIIMNGDEEFYIVENSDCGFVSKKIWDLDEGTSDYDLKLSGNAEDDYFIFGGNYDFSEGLSPEFITLYSINLFYFSKIDIFPQIVFDRLYEKGVIDKRDYLKEFLDIQMCEVKSDKAVIYSEPDQATKMYLVKYDLVEVLETQSGWVKIKYITAKGKTIIGWLREEDLDESI